MKEKLIDEIKDVISQSKSWLKLEVEYAKLTVAEKVTVLMSTLIIGAVFMMFGMLVLLLLAFALVELFCMMMVPALAYVATAGVIILLLVVFYLLKKPLLLNPIARMLTRIFFDK